MSAVILSDVVLGRVSQASQGAAGAAPALEHGQVAFTTQKGESVIAWVNGLAEPLPGAFGGYTSRAKTAQRASSQYGGVDVRGMTIPILLDGWIEGLSVAPARRLLEAMASPAGKRELTPPQPVLVTGQVPYNGLWWVISALEPAGQTLYRESDGSELRRAFTVSVVTAPVSGILLSSGKRYTVRKGDTLTSIAARQLGDGKRWKEIKTSGGKKIRDPKSIKAGQILKLP